MEFKSSRCVDEDEEGENCDDGLNKINTTNVLLIAHGFIESEVVVPVSMMSEVNTVCVNQTEIYRISLVLTSVHPEISCRGLWIYIGSVCCSPLSAWGLMRG